MARLKIAYLSADDPLDRLAWSGSHHSIFNTLQKHLGEVIALGPYQPFLPRLAGQILNRALRTLTGKRYNYRHSRLLSSAYARHFEKKLKQIKPDLVIAVSASCELASLNTGIPVLYVCDAIVHSSLRYYKSLSGLAIFSEKESLHTEELALKKSDLVVFCSSWAQKAALEKAGSLIRNSLVLPFGPNFEAPQRHELRMELRQGPCELLFVGVKWEGKGGPIAVECLHELLRAGIKAQLTICGCTPPQDLLNEHINVIPFLNKAIPSEAEQLKNLYRKADFFILPTRFEAYGVVFCEASAFAVPSLATRTGGVPDVIAEGENGFLFDAGATGKQYAEKIMDLLSKPVQYNALRRSSRERFEKRLNWDHWAKAISAEVKELTHAR